MRFQSPLNENFQQIYNQKTRLCFMESLLVHRQASVPSTVKLARKCQAEKTGFLAQTPPLGS